MYCKTLYNGYFILACFAVQLKHNFRGIFPWVQLMYINILVKGWHETETFRYVPRLKVLGSRSAHIHGENFQLLQNENTVEVVIQIRNNPYYLTNFGIAQQSSVQLLELLHVVYFPDQWMYFHGWCWIS